jgi:D-alanyl-D-alanine carboxypeptidase (penicillin-binding protein 5/6)
VTRGETVASLEVRNGDEVYQSVPLVAAEDVPIGDLTQRARDGLLELLLGWW